MLKNTHRRHGNHTGLVTPVIGLFESIWCSSFRLVRSSNIPRLKNIVTGSKWLHSWWPTMPRSGAMETSPCEFGFVWLFCIFLYLIWIINIQTHLWWLYLWFYTVLYKCKSFSVYFLLFTPVIICLPQHRTQLRSLKQDFFLLPLGNITETPQQIKPSK